MDKVVSVSVLKRGHKIQWQGNTARTIFLEKKKNVLLQSNIAGLRDGTGDSAEKCPGGH